jgi:hypothetical protein
MLQAGLLTIGGFQHLPTAPRVHCKRVCIEKFCAGKILALNKREGMCDASH